MAYRARTIKRKRRTQAEVGQLDEQIMDALRSDHPASVRHTFYMMTDPRLPEPVEKSDRGYRHVQHRVKVLREAGRLPYHWITDATRRGYHVSTFDGAEDFMRRMAGLYRADLWAQSDWYVEVWCESRSIAGVIQDTCEELAVSLYPAGGFTSMTLAYQAARYINAKGRNRSVAVLYIGDYDPAGVLIDKQVESELRKHLKADVDLHFHRVGISSRIIEAITEFSPMRRLARVTAIGGNHIFYPKVTNKASGGWVTETGDRPESQPVFDQTRIDVFEHAIIVPVSRQLLEDSFIDLQSYLSGHVAEQFGNTGSSPSDGGHQAISTTDAGDPSGGARGHAAGTHEGCRGNRRAPAPVRAEG